MYLEQREPWVVQDLQEDEANLVPLETPDPRYDIEHCRKKLSLVSKIFLHRVMMDLQEILEHVALMETL